MAKKQKAGVALIKSSSSRADMVNKAMINRGQQVPAKSVISAMPKPR